MPATRLTGQAWIRAVTIFGFLSLTLVGCGGDDYERDRARLIRAAQQQVGNSPDYMLTKISYGTNDPVALVFGMASDIEFCTELATMYMDRYPHDSYVCLPAKGYQIQDL